MNSDDETDDGKKMESKLFIGSDLVRIDLDKLFKAVEKGILRSVQRKKLSMTHHNFFQLKSSFALSSICYEKSNKQCHIVSLSLRVGVCVSVGVCV